MSECIFCKIARGEIDSAKIWEDKEFLAILDLNPNTPGMTLVLTKQHYDSDLFRLPEDVYQRLLLAAKKVETVLEKGLDVHRVAMVAEGLGVNHIHIKLYPMHGVPEKFQEIIVPERIFFEKYPGYVTTLLGPQQEMGSLKKFAAMVQRKASSS